MAAVSEFLHVVCPHCHATNRVLRERLEAAPRCGSCKAALLPGHPFDLLYTFGIRRLTGGPALPRYPLPRRFACLLATLMIVGAAWIFQSGWILAGQLFGWGLVGAALVNVTTGFCIPSFIYGLLFGPPGSCQVE